MLVGSLIKSIDWVALTCAFLLMCIGLATLFSATYIDPAAFTARFIKQAIVAAAGLIALALVIRFPYHRWQRSVPIIYVLGILSLILVAATARVVRGAASRLSLFGFEIQPSEFMRIILVISLAYTFCYFQKMGWKYFVFSAGVTVIPIALVSLEPDLGMAALLGGIWLTMLVFLGLSWRMLTGLTIVGFTFVAGTWQWLAGYQQQRLLTFLDPASDPLGAGYNVTQSIVALGSGYIIGRGLGHGPQSQLKFLPEQHTDFIFASIGEELGFAGITLILLLYSTLLWRMIRTARLTRDVFGELIVIGAFFTLLIGFVVSAGMNMGLLPVTGIPLPLVSYGGSNLLSTLILLGIVQSVHVHSRWIQAPPAEISHIT